jgi:hypothetical protein
LLNSFFSSRTFRIPLLNVAATVEFLDIQKVQPAQQRMKKGVLGKGLSFRSS